MSLKVIGAGFGRTGTNSLKTALEMLGFTKCHHMSEVVAAPQQAVGFLEAARSGHTNWDQLFEGYQASCDWPSCIFWRELAEFYPDAKVILSLRDTESWYRSIAQTLFPFTRKLLAGPANPMKELVEEIFLKQSFAGDIDNRDHVIAVYERHNQSVREGLPAGRLLEFEARQGWEPLCAFLEVPVPAADYPKTNTAEEFRQRDGSGI